MTSKSDIQLAMTKGEIIAQRGNKRLTLSYDQAFALGHALMRSGAYVRAQKIFSSLARVKGRGVRAKLMLARCKAEIDSFEASSEILSSLFGAQDAPLADELQTAFVFESLGLREDAIRELARVVKEHPDLPTACLFLGDLFDEAGNHKQAALCWKLAIKRDRRGGSVATTAKKQLVRNAKRQHKRKTAK